MKFFDIIKSLYSKDGRIPEIMDRQMATTLSKWVGYDRFSIDYVKKILPYELYIEPLHYYCLIYLTLPKKSPPFLKKVERAEPKEDKLLEKVRYVLDWSERELRFNRKILDKVLADKKYWKKELAVK